MENSLGYVIFKRKKKGYINILKNIENKNIEMTFDMVCPCTKTNEKIPKWRRAREMQTLCRVARMAKHGLK